MKLGRIALFCAVLAPLSAYSQIITLTSGASSAQISIGTDAGLFGVRDWHIGQGPNQLKQQLYLVSIDGGAVMSMNQLSAPTFTQPSADRLDVSYVSGSIEFAFRYLLTGGGLNSSDLAEVLTVNNRGGATTLRIFEYDDFDLNGTAGGDTATLLNSSTIEQVDGIMSADVGATKIPSRWEIGERGTVQSDIIAGNLTNGNSPFTGDDTAFAFQWNVGIAAESAYQLSKDKLLTVVPEPASIAAIGIGIAAFVALSRRKK